MSNNKPNFRIYSSVDQLSQVLDHENETEKGNEKQQTKMTPFLIFQS